MSFCGFCRSGEVLGGRLTKTRNRTLLSNNHTKPRESHSQKATTQKIRSPATERMQSTSYVWIIHTSACQPPYLLTKLLEEGILMLITRKKQCLLLHSVLSSNNLIINRPRALQANANPIFTVRARRSIARANKGAHSRPSESERSEVSRRSWPTQLWDANSVLCL